MILRLKVNQGRVIANSFGVFGTGEVFDIAPELGVPLVECGACELIEQIGAPLVNTDLAQDELRVESAEEKAFVARQMAKLPKVVKRKS